VKRYGIGFKVGSMRLGKDAMVITTKKDSDEVHVGFLSITLNQNHSTLQVPVLTYDVKKCYFVLFIILFLFLFDLETYE